MLTALVDWSVRNRVVALALAAFLLVLGSYAAGHAKLDVFPEFAPPEVVIQTEAPGLSPQEVEQLVTQPIETAVNGLPRLDVIRSKSVQGLSVITVIFNDGTDIYRARQQVGERLAELAGQMPEGVRSPRMAPLTAATGRLVTVGFTSEKLSPQELRDVIQWNVRPRLLGVGGVASVTIYGGEVRQFQVRVDPDALAARGLSVTDVLDAARQATGVRGAGFVENDRQRLTLRAEGQVRSARELGDTLLLPTVGSPIRLKDVADVSEGAAPKFGDAAVNGTPAVTLVVSKQIDVDTPDTTRRVEAELEDLRPILEKQGITYHPALFRQADFIEVAVGNVTHSLVLGAVLVAIVLFVFLFNLRTAFISLTAIPLSLLGAVTVLWACGVSLNTLTLGGLAIAVGEVVDDAIIDVENIFRRLRENAAAGNPRSTAGVILSASLEVRSAVVYATFIVILVFVPVFFLTGLQGRLFAPLGYAYVLAVLASLLVALTVTPALSMFLLPRASGAEEPPLLRRLQGGYERLLRWLDRQFALVVVLTMLLIAAAAWAMLGFGGEFLPEMRENHAVVHMRGLPGSSLPESMAAGRNVTAELRKRPDVRSVSQQAGRAELGEDTWGVEYSELEVDLTPLRGEDAEKVQRELRRALKQTPGYSFEVMPFLTERIKETLSGTSGSVVVKVHGEELASIDRTAADVARVLNDIPGHDNVLVEPQIGAPELVIRVRAEDAARFGLRPVQVLDAVRTAFQGTVAGQVYDRNRVYDVVVLLDDNTRMDVDAVAELWLTVPASLTATPPAGVVEPRASPTESGVTAGKVRLKQVADVFLSDGRFLISHEGATRRVAVTCQVKGRDLGSFVAEAERRVKSVELPRGVYVSFGGEYEAKRTAQRELLWLSVGASVGIVLLMWSAFGSVRRLILLLLNLPFALVGGVMAVYAKGGVLDVGSMIGFVTLFGITMRNGIMMVSHWQHLREHEGVAWGADLIVRGARERLAPVLMTALVTGLGLLPIALGSGEAGREIEGPMAMVILGGLFTSTVLNLLVLPILFRRFGD
ncbi:MAG: efflux RND transporter permease subunit [Gemmataceae bacterium]